VINEPQIVRELDWDGNDAWPDDDPLEHDDLSSGELAGGEPSPEARL
jgi:hypothetical protein